MTKEEMVKTGSEILWDRGIRILQGNRLAPTDEEHVAKLARHMDLSGEEHNIVDMGCGFGEVSRLLSHHVPNAIFWLVNNDKYQIERCRELPELPELSNILNSDMLNTGLPNDCMDMVMFNYSLCLVDVEIGIGGSCKDHADHSGSFSFTITSEPAETTPSRRSICSQTF